MICWIEAHPGLAAWVQAVFSVIAILAAIGIAVWQRHVDREATRIAQLETDNRIRSVATMGANLALKTINDLAEVAKVVSLSLYRDGAVARLQQGINFFARVDLTRLTLQEAQAVADVIGGCMGAIAMVSTAVTGDDVMTRLHISGGLYGIRAKVGDVKLTFPDVVH